MGHGIPASDFIALGALTISGLAFVLGRLDRRRDLDRWTREQSRQAPELLVDWNWNVGGQGVWIGLNVTATPGRPSTSLVEAGFTMDGLAELRRRPDVEYPPAEPQFAQGRVSFPVVRELIACEPGRRYPFMLTPGALPHLLDVDSELRPYAIDIEGRRSLGPPQAIFQRLRDHGWQQPADSPATFAVLKIDYVEPPSHHGISAMFDLTGSIPTTDLP